MSNFFIAKNKVLCYNKNIKEGFYEKIIVLAICIVLIMTTFCGCGDTYEYDEVINDEELSLYAEESTSDYSETSESEIVTSRKLIKEVDLTVETKDYDNYIKSLRDNVTSNKGYIETFDETGDSDFRSFTATIRIPYKKTDSFTEFAATNVTVIERSESVDDVTEQYVDIEARIKVYKAEEESLIEIMKEAQNVTDLLSVKEQLTEVRAQIESYTAQLKSLENRIDYSTITITVDEVEREHESEGYWSEIWNNILDAFGNIIDFVVAVFAFILSTMPYLLVPAVIGLIVLFIIRKVRKKK